MEQIKPPTITKGPVGWLRENLFNTWYNVLLTCIALTLLILVFKGFLTWAFTEAEWSVIPANLQLFAVGSYPREQIWRVWSVIYVLAVLLGLSAGIWGKFSPSFCLYTRWRFSYLCRSPISTVNARIVFGYRCSNRMLSLSGTGQEKLTTVDLGRMDSLLPYNNDATTWVR